MDQKITHKKFTRFMNKAENYHKLAGSIRITTSQKSYIGRDILLNWWLKNENSWDYQTKWKN